MSSPFEKPVPSRFETVSKWPEEQKRAQMLDVRHYWLEGEGKLFAEKFLAGMAQRAAENPAFRKHEAFHLVSGSTMFKDKQLPFDTGDQQILRSVLEFNADLLTEMNAMRIERWG